MMNLQTLTRRDALRNTACGCGALALAELASEQERAESTVADAPPHQPSRARRVIFLSMQGGPSHVDTFDHKPLLARHDGESFEFADDRVKANTGMRT